MFTCCFLSHTHFSVTWTVPPSGRRADLQLIIQAMANQKPKYLLE